MQEKIIEAFNWRSAVKIFNDLPVEQSLVDTILEAGRMSPSAYGIQPYKIIHVESPELRAQIKEAAFGQAKVTDSPHLFVVAARTDLEENISEFVENIAKTRGVTLESLEDFKKNMLGDIGSRSPEDRLAWAGRQAYIAFGAMLETAALLGVDAGPMEGFIPSKVDEILNLKDLNLKSLGLFVLGYRGDDKYSTWKKVRFSKEELIIKK